MLCITLSDVQFQSYEALRREHDAQIMRIAMESGLRIGPEQYSNLLYGKNTYKSQMQSILDKVCVATGAPLWHAAVLLYGVVQCVSLVCGYSSGHPVLYPPG